MFVFWYEFLLIYKTRKEIWGVFENQQLIASVTGGCTSGSEATRERERERPLHAIIWSLVVKRYVNFHVLSFLRWRKPVIICHISTSLVDKTDPLYEIWFRFVPVDKKAYEKSDKYDTVMFVTGFLVFSCFNRKI